jgi:hypothetical protein
MGWNRRFITNVVMVWVKKQLAKTKTGTIAATWFHLPLLYSQDTRVLVLPMDKIFYSPSPAGKKTQKVLLEDAEVFTHRLGLFCSQNV